MIAELVLVICLSPTECATDRVQMPAQECIERAAQELREIGREVDDPPYLRQSPECVLRTARRE